MLLHPVELSDVYVVLKSFVVWIVRNLYTYLSSTGRLLKTTITNDEKTSAVKHFEFGANNVWSFKENIIDNYMGLNRYWLWKLTHLIIYSVSDNYKTNSHFVTSFDVEDEYH